MLTCPACGARGPGRATPPLPGGDTGAYTPGLSHSPTLWAGGPTGRPAVGELGSGDTPRPAIPGYELLGEGGMGVVFQAATVAQRDGRQLAAFAFEDLTRCVIRVWGAVPAGQE